MCHHVFVFPEDKPENYNPDGRTLTGRCKCGAIQMVGGRRWALPKYDDVFLYSAFDYEQPGFLDRQIKLY